MRVSVDRQRWGDGAVRSYGLAYRFATRRGVATAVAVSVVSGACAGDAPVRANPSPPSDRIVFSKLAAGSRHTCGIDDTGVAYCWGSNAAGQLGVADVPIATASPTPVDTEVRFADLAAGAVQTCGVGRDGVTYCWGMGVGRRRTAPEPIPFSLELESLASQSEHICGVADGGQVACWGSGHAGQLGTGAFGVDAVSTDPQLVGGAPGLTAVFTGEAFSCGLAVSGAAYCWGGHDLGQLGSGTRSAGPCLGDGGSPFPCVTMPDPVAGGFQFTSLATGLYHACGVEVAGIPYCWGDNSAFQLARVNALETCTDADGIDRPCSRTPVLSDGNGAFLTLAGGGFHTCGLDDDGSAFCWGDNSFGQIGDGSFVSAQRPARVRGGLSFISLSAGRNFTCGVTNAGDGYCWGRNADGQLGSDDAVAPFPRMVGSSGSS